MQLLQEHEPKIEHITAEPEPGFPLGLGVFAIRIAFTFIAVTIQVRWKNSGLPNENHLASKT